jgi:hypothetical protein
MIDVSIVVLEQNHKLVVNQRQNVRRQIKHVVKNSR